MLVLAVLLVCAVLASVASGATPLPLVGVVRIVLSRLSGSPAFSDPMMVDIVWEIRLPRALLAALVGASLATAGAALQTVTGNRLADPHLLGVSAGASLGAVAATLLGGVWLHAGLPLCAFVGALASTAAVVALSTQRQRLRPERLILCGIAVSFVAMSAANLLLYLGDQRAAGTVLYWMLGGFGLAQWRLLLWPALGWLGCGTALLLHRRAFDALLGGDIAAVSLGVAVGRLRVQTLVLCALLTALCVSVSGVIGFVGLVAPHLSRRLVGAAHARLMPVAALMGASMLVGADLLSRVLIPPEELPVGIVTSLVGGLVLVFALRRDR